MLIANPIYDVVFNLLMSDLDVAKGFISRILGRLIITLNLPTQGVPIKKMDQEGEAITLMRRHFIATVEDENQGLTEVLIEIQKAKIPEDIGRDAFYLGQEYKSNTDTKTASGQSDPSHLPLFTIYILNFSLDKDLPPLIRIQRDCKNATTQEPLGPDVHDEFIKSITHDSFIAQISTLPEKPVEVLERTFALFNQNLVQGKNRHQLYLDDGTSLQDDELIAKMAGILHQAVVEPDIVQQMELEDVLQQDFELSFQKMKLKIEQLQQEKEAICGELNETLRLKEAICGELNETLRLKEEFKQKKRDFKQGNKSPKNHRRLIF